MSLVSAILLLLILVGVPYAFWAGRAYRRGFTAGVRFGRDLAEEKVEMTLKLDAWMREERAREMDNDRPSVADMHAPLSNADIVEQTGEWAEIVRRYDRSASAQTSEEQICLVREDESDG